MRCNSIRPTNTPTRTPIYERIFSFYVIWYLSNARMMHDIIPTDIIHCSLRMFVPRFHFGTNILCNDVVYGTRVAHFGRATARHFRRSPHMLCLLLCADCRPDGKSHARNALPAIYAATDSIPHCTAARAPMKLLRIDLRRLRHNCDLNFTHVISP